VTKPARGIGQRGSNSMQTVQPDRPARRVGQSRAVLALLVRAKILVRPPVALLERLPLPLTGAALRPTIALLLLAALTKTALVAPWRAVVGMTMVPRRAAATRRTVATTRTIGVRRFHCPGYRPRDGGCPWG